MDSLVYSYPLTILETHLDSFGHVNNAVYLILYEEARWDLLNQNGYSLAKIKELSVGPTILSVKMDFLKELKARDKVIIETRCSAYKGKICTLEQKMLRNGEICNKAEFVIALFDLKQRKLISPTPEWLQAIGLNESELSS